MWECLFCNSCINNDTALAENLVCKYYVIICREDVDDVIFIVNNFFIKSPRAVFSTCSVCRALCYRLGGRPGLAATIFRPGDKLSSCVARFRIKWRQMSQNLPHSHVSMSTVWWPLQPLWCLGGGGGWYKPRVEGSGPPPPCQCLAGLKPGRGIMTLPSQAYWVDIHGPQC